MPRKILIFYTDPVNISVASQSIARMLPDWSPTYRSYGSLHSALSSNDFQIKCIRSHKELQKDGSIFDRFSLECAGKTYRSGLTFYPTEHLGKFKGKWVQGK